MGHISDEFLNSKIKIAPNNRYRRVLAYLIYRTEDLVNVKENGVVSGNDGVFSFLNGMKIDLQYIETKEIFDLFGHIDFSEFGESNISYSISGEVSVHCELYVFSSLSISEERFGFNLNMESLKEMLKDFKFYEPRGRFHN